ncbi:hypothetical protein PAAG_06746 [Paracoccidioides lutzii Pb01]|uniref:Uncharacterized protein n=1 Tax=Paracoccidioides lutzii (strain ATCC MYA-826 / Pb01) TaxID=502779 RepID=C1H7K5_PARBA|nr:hypothetical protein PAAG_06746 [Paracoccidioides lutzii Pb01]EEH36328.2 hypothetical protein PAAG_06746 [Paracoccidioides lutzii Pb01]
MWLREVRANNTFGYCHVQHLAKTEWNLHTQQVQVVETRMRVRRLELAFWLRAQSGCSHDYYRGDRQRRIRRTEPRDAETRKAGRGLNFFRSHLQIGVRVNGVETRDPGNDGPGIGTAHITAY